MTNRPNISEDVRHARLFELIRQENVVARTAERKSKHSSTDLREMQQFLKQAHLSLSAHHITDE